MKFNVGDRVKCINDKMLLTSSDLTIGKVYVVKYVRLAKDGSEVISVITDKEEIHSFYSSRFVLDMKYIRSEKLKRIGL